MAAPWGALHDERLTCLRRLKKLHAGQICYTLLHICSWILTEILMYRINSKIRPDKTLQGGEKNLNWFVVIQCPRKTEQALHFIQGGWHVVVYVRTAGWAVLAGCSSAHMLPNKISRTTRRQIPFWDTSGPRPLPLNRDIWATATTTLGQCTVKPEDLQSKQSSKSQTFLLKYQWNRVFTSPKFRRDRNLRPIKADKGHEQEKSVVSCFSTGLMGDKERKNKPSTSLRVELVFRHVYPWRKSQCHFSIKKKYWSAATSGEVF